MYSGIDIIGTLGLFLLLRIILPISTIFFLGEWLNKRRQEKMT